MVQIMTGALCDQVGLFDCATDNERVFILLDLLGRKVRVRVPLGTVSAYA
jgi:transcriptional antiterminator RfaH